MVTFLPLIFLFLSQSPSQVINLWGYALNYENTFLLSSFYAILIVFINFTVTIGDIIYMCELPDSLSPPRDIN
jgi:hypothetical protein